MSRTEYYPDGDGITKIMDPFWRNTCGKCGSVFWSCLCTAKCLKCGNQDMERTLGGMPYGQVVAERGEPAGPVSK